MGIRGRTLGLVGLLVAITWVVAVAGAVMYANSVARQSEQADVKVALDRATGGLRVDAEPMNLFVSDWSGWDDTYNFIDGTNPDYQRSVLTTDDLNAYNVDFIVVTNKRGSIVGSVAADPVTRAAIPLQPGIANYLATDPPILHLNQGGEATGVIGVPEGVAVLAANAVTDTNGNAPTNGIIIAGRFLTPARLDAIEEVSAVPLVAYSLRATSVPEAVDLAKVRLLAGRSFVSVAHGWDSVAGYVLYKDIEGANTAVVEVVQPRQSMVQARNAVVIFSIAMLVLIGLLFVFVAIALDQVVLRRLQRLNTELAEIGEAGDASARLAISGDDEIGDVANGVNSMLGEIEASQSDLAYFASHDPLTRLFNRRRFETELQARLSEPGACGALLWIDLDHFKEVNDSLGHVAGDQLLVALANLLSGETRGVSTLARLGGDEFGILIPGAGLEEATRAVSRLIDTLANHVFGAGEHDVRMSASVGVVLYPEHGNVADDLLARADLAMYHAKSSGRSRAVVYSNDDDWQTEMTERIGLASEIVSALNEDRFVLYAQPSIRVADGSPGPFELLLRLPTTDGRVIMPEQIIPTAERIGLIRDVDRWVLRRAIDLIASEQLAGRDTRLSVNLSAMAFADAGLDEMVRSAFESAGADPGRLTIEITETAAIVDLSRAQDFMREVKEVGCRFALDNFGSGASSFFYLRQLPIDDLKIDGSLVCNLAKPEDAHFLSAIVEMCKGLSISTVAEHVEDDEHLRLVRERGVDYAQGRGIGSVEPLEHYIGEDRAQ